MSGMQFWLKLFCFKFWFASLLIKGKGKFISQNNFPVKTFQTHFSKFQVETILTQMPILQKKYVPPKPVSYIFVLVEFFVGCWTLEAAIILVKQVWDSFIYKQKTSFVTLN